MFNLSEKWRRRVKITLVILFIIFLLVFLINTAFVEFTTPDTDTETSNNSLEVLSYNIHGFVSEFNMKPAIDLIIEISPDIMVVQEAVRGLYNGIKISPVQFLSSNLNLSHYGPLSGDISNPSAVSILSKYPIIDEYKVKLPSLQISIKYLLVAIINTPKGNMTVFGTHLERPFSPSVQADQADRIIEEAEKYDDVVFMCDCNSPDVIFHPAYNKFARYFQDAWIADGNHSWEGNTWETPNPVLRVDYIWYKGKISVVEGSTELQGDEKQSDHRAMSTKIVLNNE